MVGNVALRIDHFYLWNRTLGFYVVESAAPDDQFCVD
jgi:hypothetical protein